MVRSFLVALFLTGCLSATPGSPDESDAQGGDGAVGDGQAADGPDGGVDVADANGVTNDAGPDYFDTWIISWTKTGGDCPVADNAMDRAQTGSNFLRYYSVACPDVGYEQQGVTWNGGTATSFGGGFALENCARDEYEHLPDHSLVFDASGFSGEISAVRKRVSDNGVICSIDLLVEGVRE